MFSVTHDIVEGISPAVSVWTAVNCLVKCFLVTWRTSKVILFIDIFILMNNNYLSLFIPLPKPPWNTHLHTHTLCVVPVSRAKWLRLSFSSCNCGVLFDCSRLLRWLQHDTPVHMVSVWFWVPFLHIYSFTTQCWSFSDAFMQNVSSQFGLKVT